MYTEQELNRILSELRDLPAETEWVEFKAARYGFGDNDMGEYFSALSNEANLKKSPMRGSFWAWKTVRHGQSLAQLGIKAIAPH